MSIQILKSRFCFPLIVEKNSNNIEVRSNIPSFPFRGKDKSGAIYPKGEGQGQKSTFSPVSSHI